MPDQDNGDHKTAYFGGGCFWCTEAVFSRLKGVSSVEPGYAGGDMPNPTYDEVCTGETGHAEVVKVEFDPEVISYRKLVEVFLTTHNPTTINQQGADRGTQYRSIILYTSEAQRQQAEKAIDEFDQAGIYDDPIVTEVEPLDQFFSAEDYHRRYYDNQPTAPYCQAVINPKLAKLRHEFADLMI